MDDIDQLIDRLLGDQDTESEFGRVRTYRLCVRFAEEALAEDRRCNAFLLRAAERLGQAPMALPVVFNRVPLPEAARACFYIHEDDGPVLVGNRDGLRYLAALLAELAEAPVPGESIYLDPDFEPFVGDSDGLLVYAENEDWFAALDDGREDELAAEWEAEITARIMNPAHIVALQFERQLPLPLAFSPHRIYRVFHVGEITPATDADVPRLLIRPASDRLRVLALRDDDGQPVQLIVDLDDLALTFYYPWHLEQFAEAFAPDGTSDTKQR